MPKLHPQNADVRSCNQHERCEIDEDGKHWRLILSYKRNEQGEMTDLWANDPWAKARVVAAEHKGKST